MSSQNQNNSDDDGVEEHGDNSNDETELIATTSNKNNVAAKIPLKFVPTPFPYHFQVIIQIDSLSDMGWGKGHILTQDTQQLPQDIMKDNEFDFANIIDKVPADWEIRVPLVLPEEIVLVKIFKNSDKYSEADLINVIQASPSGDRVKPRCPLAGICGGCQFQHMKIERQREWKTDFVKRGLEAQHIKGYLSITSIPNLLLPTKGTDEIYGYRNKLTPHYQAPIKIPARREGEDDEYELEAIGFQQMFSRRLVDVEQCPIATTAINSCLKHTRRSLHEQAKKGLLNNKKRRRRSRRSKKVDAGATLLFRQADDDIHGNPVVITDNNEYMTTTVKGIKFRHQAGNFFQNNNYVVPLMVDAVIEAATQIDSSTNKCPSYLIDCYCGSGLFALSASSKFKLCVGIEVNEKAVNEATENAIINKIKNCQFVAANAEAIFTSPPVLTIPGFENQKIQDFEREETVVVLDPPRKGCSGKFLEQLYDYSPQKIIYMSCGPSTQARDAKGIVEIGGYDIVTIQPFDLFPQTKHVECLIVFEKKL